MSKIIDGITSATGVKQQAARVYEVLGGHKPDSLVKRSTVGEFIHGVGADAPLDVADGIGTVAGAAAGLYLWRKEHPYLGLFGGASLGRNLPAMLKPELRRAALCNMAVTGAAIAASLLVPKAPAMSFIAGGVAAGAVVHFGGFRK